MFAGLLAFHRDESLFLAGSFGSFERIDFLRFFDFDFYMGCGRAVAGHPFAFRVRINLAVLACFVFENFVAVTALINDRMTAAPEEAATFFRHKTAFHSLFNCFTKHLICPPLNNLNDAKFRYFDNGLIDPKKIRRHPLALKPACP